MKRAHEIPISVFIHILFTYILFQKRLKIARKRIICHTGTVTICIQEKLSQIIPNCVSKENIVEKVYCFLLYFFYYF